MFSVLSPHFRDIKVVLASSSPRRIEILTQLGLLSAIGNTGDTSKFEVIPSTFVEDLDKTKFTGHPEKYCMATASGKSVEVCRRLAATQKNNNEGDSNPAECLILGADTVVVSHDGTIFEKPVDHAHAFRMLAAHREGTHHRVITGVVFAAHTQSSPNLARRISKFAKRSDSMAHDPYHAFDPHEDVSLVTFCEETRVHFADSSALTDQILRSYVESNEPMGKAGAYGIQGFGGTLVSRIDGDYFNVMGLPGHRIATNLVKLFATS